MTFLENPAFVIAVLFDTFSGEQRKYHGLNILPIAVQMSLGMNNTRYTTNLKMMVMKGTRTLLRGGRNMCDQRKVASSISIAGKRIKNLQGTKAYHIPR